MAEVGLEISGALYLFGNTEKKVRSIIENAHGKEFESRFAMMPVASEDWYRTFSETDSTVEDDEQVESGYKALCNGKTGFTFADDRLVGIISTNSEATGVVIVGQSQGVKWSMSKSEEQTEDVASHIITAVQKLSHKRVDLFKCTLDYSFHVSGKFGLSARISDVVSACQASGNDCRRCPYRYLGGVYHTHIYFLLGGYKLHAFGEESFLLENDMRYDCISLTRASDETAEEFLVSEYGAHIARELELD